jgi:alanyl-tRNA synthetase
MRASQAKAVEKFGGRGGGKATFAQAGCADAEGLKRALMSESFVQDYLEPLKALGV